MAQPMKALVFNGEAGAREIVKLPSGGSDAEMRNENT